MSRACEITLSPISTLFRSCHNWPMSAEDDGPRNVTDRSIQRPARRIFVSTTSIFAANVATALLGALNLHVMTMHLGPSGYGLFVTVLTFITSTMLLTDIGINAMTGREISRNPESARQILGINVGLRIALSVMLIPLIWVVGRLTYMNHPSANQIQWGVLILALAIPFDAIRAVSLGYFVSRIENHRTAIVGLINQVLFVGLTITGLELHGGVLSCFWAYLAATAVSALVAFIGTFKRVRFHPVVNVRGWIAALRASFSIGVIQIVNLVYLRVDTFMCSLFLTSADVAQYGLAYSVISFFLVIPYMYGTSMLPLMATADEESLIKHVQRSVVHMTILGSLISAGCITAGAGVIYDLAGSRFNRASLPLSILSASVILTGVTSVFGYASFSRDKHHRMLYVSVCGLLINVGLNLYAIPHFGVRGASVVVIISELFVAAGTYTVFRLQVGHRIHIIRHMLRPTAAAVATILIVKVAIDPMRTKAVTTGAVIALVVVLYSVILAVMGGWPPELRAFLGTNVRRWSVKGRPSP